MLKRLRRVVQPERHTRAWELAFGGFSLENIVFPSRDADISCKMGLNNDVISWWHWVRDSHHTGAIHLAFSKGTGPVIV